MAPLAERSDLLLALHAGEGDDPPWRRFLDGLAHQCSADGAALAFAHAGDGYANATTWRSTPRRQDDIPQVFSSALDTLRPGRVYALEELAEPSGAHAGGVRAATGPGMTFGRVLRVSETGAWTAWLGIFRRAGDLAAIDAARISALSPHLGVALGNFAKREHARLRAAIADDLLARANIAWRAYTSDGRVIAAAPSSPLGPRSRSEAEEQSEAARLATRIAEAPLISRTNGDGAALAIPIVCGELAAPAPKGVTIIARPERAPAANVARALEEIWSLTPSEARFAAALAAGDSLTAAAARLGVTVETARNYSKRAYAKTGASGQADLVRRVLTSVAALA